jgi:hypothetical protein
MRYCQHHDATNKFLKAIEELQSLEKQRAAAGITLTDFDADFAASGIPHIDGASLNAVLNTSIPAIWTFMTGANHDDNLQKVRS